MKISQEKLARIQAHGTSIDRERETRKIERIAGMFPRGFLSIVASQAGTGKTWLMQYIASQLSVGGRILKGMARCKPYKSVIMSGETGSELLDIRQKATCWKYNKENMRVYSAVDLALDNIEVMLNTPEGKETAVAIIHQEKPDVVFYDTLISWHTLDESKQGEMTAIFMFLLRLAKSFNCAVVVNHHTRKRPANMTGKKYTQEDVIGSSAGVRLANAVYLITGEELPYGKSRMTVQNVKAWDKKIPNFSYEFIDDPETGLIDFKVSFDTDGTGSNLFWATDDRIEKYVDELATGAMFSIDDIATAIGCSTDYCRERIEKYIARTGKLSKCRIMGIKQTMYRVDTGFADIPDDE